VQAGPGASAPRRPGLPPRSGRRGARAPRRRAALRPACPARRARRACPALTTVPVTDEWPVPDGRVRPVTMMLSATVAVWPSGPVAARSALWQVSVSQPGPRSRPARVCAGAGNCGSVPSRRQDQGEAEAWSISTKRPPGRTRAAAFRRMRSRSSGTGLWK
jgi:hypothetical protein